MRPGPTAGQLSHPALRDAQLNGGLPHREVGDIIGRRLLIVWLQVGVLEGPANCTKSRMFVLRFSLALAGSGACRPAQGAAGVPVTVQLGTRHQEEIWKQADRRRTAFTICFVVLRHQWEKEE